MKILWVSQNLPYPPKTGVLQRNYNLIREATSFAEVHLIAILKQDILPDYDAKLAEEELAKLCASVTVVQLPTEMSRFRFFWVLFKSLFTRLPFTVNWANCQALRDAISSACASHSFQLAYFDTISLAPYRKQVEPAACVLNHHNIESGLFDRRIQFEPNSLLRFYLRQEVRKLKAYESSIVHTFDVNLTVSELDAERLLQISPRVRTAVVANGVDVGYFSPRHTSPETGHLVMVSGMNWFPNRDAAIFMAQDIWPLVSAVIPASRLTIVGTSPPPAILELAARDTRVAVTGFANDVRPYIERAQIYLCPMRDGGGTRLKILDALAMCRPIVATTMALEGIAVTPEREVLIANTPAEFVSQIERIVKNPEFGRELAVNGRAYVERHFSWAVIRDNMRMAFESAINSRAKHE